MAVFENRRAACVLHVSTGSAEDCHLQAGMAKMDAT
jgi:hypothetical protein